MTMEKIFETIRNRNVELIFKVEKEWGQGGTPEYTGVCTILDYDKDRITTVRDLEWDEGFIGVSKNLQENILKILLD